MAWWQVRSIEFPHPSFCGLCLVGQESPGLPAWREPDSLGHVGRGRIWVLSPNFFGLWFPAL